MMWHFFIKKLQNKFTRKKFTNQYQIKTSIATDSQTHGLKKKKITNPPMREKRGLPTTDGDPSSSRRRQQPLTDIPASLAHWKQTNPIVTLSRLETNIYIHKGISPP